MQIHMNKHFMTIFVIICIYSFIIPAFINAYSQSVGLKGLINQDRFATNCCQNKNKLYIIIITTASLSFPCICKCIKTNTWWWYLLSNMFIHLLYSHLLMLNLKVCFLKGTDKWCFTSQLIAVKTKISYITIQQAIF